MSDDPDKPWRLPNAKRMTFDDMAARAQYEWQRAEDAEAEAKHQADRIEELEAKLAKAVEAGVDVAASLNAAISLLERGGKKAAPSDKIFNQMLVDYNASLDRFRTTLAELTSGEAATKEGGKDD